MVKKKKSLIERILKKNQKQKVISKTILKQEKMTVKIPEYKAPSVLNEPNRFFKSELEEAKKAMFFK